jgi:hypothetical protein
MSQQMSQSMIDFRDTIWGPGRYLLDGGNPYDHNAYLAANSGAQEFDPYAPAWLLLAVAIGALPFDAAAAVYLVLGAVIAVVLGRTVVAWGAPGLLRVGVPLVLIYLCVWGPGKYALQNGGTLLVVLGWVLVVRDVVEHASASRWVEPRRGEADDPIRVRSVIPSGTWPAAVGLALSLLKPQFGLPLIVIALAVGRWAVIWRGAVVLLAASTPVIVACSVAAGGFNQFVGSILQLTGYAASPSAQTGLSSTGNSRADLLGMLARLTGTAPPAWVQVVVPLAVLAAAILVVRRTRGALTIIMGVAAATLLAVVHQYYDSIILVAPAVVTFHVLLTRRPIARVELIVGLLGLIPLLKLYQVAQFVAPGSGNVGAEFPTTAAVTAALAVSAVAALTVRRQAATLVDPPLSRSTP